MNERMIDLDKLAAQSLVYADTGLDDGKELIFSKEKFAELIVRECASIADEPTSQPFDSYGKKIKQHFGVQE